MDTIQERQDLNQIEEINAFISDIKTKINNHEYETHYLTDDHKYYYASLNVNGLNIYLTNVKYSFDGYFGVKDYNKFKAPYVIINNNRITKNNIKFDDETLGHEISHYLDYSKGNKIFSSSLDSQGNVTKNYSNNPTELNAYIIQILREYFQKVPLKKLSNDFQSFYKDFWKRTYVSNYYNQLNDNNRRKFEKRIYDFYIKLNEKKNQMNLNEIIKEEIQSLNEINVFHGSTEKFDTFDMNKIGTGDGKSLGGWGIYFSDNPEVSKRYYLPKGSFIETNIRDGRYFDLDAPVSENSDEIISGLERMGVDENEIEEFKYDYGENYDANNKQAYDWLSYVLGSEKDASLFLKSLGYLGNTFKDKWEDGQNYVVFDTSTIKQ